MSECGYTRPGDLGQLPRCNTGWYDKSFIENARAFILNNLSFFLPSCLPSFLPAFLPSFLSFFRFFIHSLILSFFPFFFLLSFFA